MASSSSSSSVVRRTVAPSIGGLVLTILAFVVERVPFLARLLLRRSGLLAIRSIPASDPLHFLPASNLPLPEESWWASRNKQPATVTAPPANALLTPADVVALATTADDHDRAGVASARPRQVRVADFAAAYAAGRVTPSQVIESLIKIIEAVDAAKDGADPTKLHYLFQWSASEARAQAAASTARFASGRALGPLDGVPVLIKDEFDVRGFETRCGTNFLNRGRRAARDAEVVARLRAAGAVILGKSGMDEWGWNTFGINQVTGTPRNPYDLQRSCGGSSGACGGAVAAGLCPIAIGADGGGSIRIPSSFCGTFGLKPTTARLSSSGHYPVAATVGVAGPLTSSALDLALAYLAIAGPDEKDPLTLRQPRPFVPRSILSPSMNGVRIGIMPEYAAQVMDPAIARVMTRVQERQEGAVLVPIDVPYLEEIRLAHSITISGEMVAAARLFERSAGLAPTMIPANRVLYATMSRLPMADYVLSQRLRAALIRRLQRAFAPAERAG
ncbi:hypothetical protein HK405_006001, partial [Cladochytrium tenue]